LTLLDDDQNVDTVPPVTQVPEPAGPKEIAELEGELEPGSYWIDPDGDDSTPLTVTYEIADDGWEAWIGASRITDGAPASRITNGPHTMLSITTVTNVVRDGCLDHEARGPVVGPTVDDLAIALTNLAPFEVTAPPTDVTLLGYEGKHLELTVPDRGFVECESRQLHSWTSPLLGGAFNGYNGPEPGLTEEFWILDVGGTRLVIVYNTSPDAPADWLAKRQAIVDSIQIEP
jgi:hypothetical protein